ncbi:MAG: hypothetical protein LBV27_07130 [Oscillospiraceae bacterium]|nr:hypothetical protein [Oscillospiraceae bacterium]
MKNNIPVIFTFAVEECAVEELADILEVIVSIMDFKGLSEADLNGLRMKKRDARGGFEKQINLIDVESDG